MTVMQSQCEEEDCRTKTVMQQWRRASPPELPGQFQIQIHLISAGLDLIQLLHGLLADVVQLTDRIIQGGDLLLLQVLGALGHHYELLRHRWPDVEARAVALDSSDHHSEGGAFCTR